MADVRISDMPAASAANDAMQVEVNDGGTTRSITIANLKAWFAATFSAIASPAFTGVPTAPTPAAADNSSTIATTSFVQGVLSTLSTSITNALTLKAPLASPVLTGAPTAPTQAAGDASTKLATTAYADRIGATIPTRGQIYAAAYGDPLNFY